MFCRSICYFTWIATWLHYVQSPHVFSLSPFLVFSINTTFRRDFVSYIIPVSIIIMMIIRTAPDRAPLTTHSIRPVRPASTQSIWSIVPSSSSPTTTGHLPITHPWPNPLTFVQRFLFYFFFFCMAHPIISQNAVIRSPKWRQIACSASHSIVCGAKMPHFKMNFFFFPLLYHLQKRIDSAIITFTILFYLQTSFVLSSFSSFSSLLWFFPSLLTAIDSRCRSID